MSHIPYYGQAENRIEYNKFTDEHFITIPDDIIQLLKLESGDVLVWTLNEGKVYIAKR
jgi:hypothetical protein